MKKVFFTIFSFILLGVGCSSTQKLSQQDDKVTQPSTDYFSKKVECNNLRAKTEQKINEDYGSRSDIAFDKICFSIKFNSCVIKFTAYPKDKDTSLEEFTSFRDALTGELLGNVNLFKEADTLDYEYENGIAEIEDRVNCAK